MAELSMLTVLLIRSNTTQILATQDEMSKKWRFTIFMMERKPNGEYVPRPVLSSEYIHETKKEAIVKAKEVIAQVREVEL